MNGSGAEIAIVGASLRLPGARDLDQLWRNLRSGVESISRLSREQLLAAGLPVALIDHPRYVPAHATIDDIDRFDAALFGFTPREAELIDPQQRMFLECAWEALEHAGYNPQSYSAVVGVFAGATRSSYLAGAGAGAELSESMQVFVGNERDFLPTQVSYQLDLTGPSINVQTACSTSLVAVHLACQSLLSGECDVALAGGVSVHVPQDSGYLYQPGMILSPDGRCRTFSKDAAGTVSGSGLAVIVLKRLADALDDGSRVLGVIKGSAVNNDGRSRVGFTAPGIDGQRAVIMEALAVAGASAESIGYVEAHGTATKLGDPNEVAALTQAFAADTSRRGFCGLGSIKSNMGHLDTAAGVAGLLKAMLAIAHGELVPTLHCAETNPAIDFESGPFFVSDRVRPWPATSHPRRAGVSSFGIGGTNAHVILEQAPERPPSSPGRTHELLVLSAASSAALDRLGHNLASHLEEHTEQELADVAFTLATGRRRLKYRRALVCSSPASAIAALRGEPSAWLRSRSDPSQDRPVAFLFPGQGAQHIDMARGLRGESAFAEAFVECATGFRRHLPYDLEALVYGAGAALDRTRELADTTRTQPALFAVEYALARQWMAWGIEPSALLGHSIGELVAACVAGVFTLDDAIEIVALRAQLMGRQARGAMLSVALGEGELRALMPPALAIAALNVPGQSVVSGSGAEIERFARLLEGRGVAARRLDVSHAFHSPMMEGMIAEFGRCLDRVPKSPPQVPIVSSVTGGWLTEAQARATSYWVRQVVLPVRFADGIATLAASPERALLEVGPGTTLTRLARAHPERDPDQLVISSCRHREEQRGDLEALLAALGQLVNAGVAVDWPAVYDGQSRRRVALPTYPFARDRYWLSRHVSTERIDPGRIPAAESGRLHPESSVEPVPLAGVATAADDERAAGTSRPELGHDAIPPRTPREEQLQAIWRDLLGYQGIGVHDDFFELGGHSLLATQVISRIHAGFAVALPVVTLFEHPTIAGLAAAIGEHLERPSSADEPASRAEPLARRGERVAPLSFSQQRLWFADRLEGGHSAYNEQIALRVEGPLRVELLQRAFEAVIARHESLRTVFVDERGQPRQQVRAPSPLAIARERLSWCPAERPSAALRERIARDRRVAFELSEAPPLRVSLIELDEQVAVLVVTMHHIITDGWSMGVLLAELSVCYAALEAGEPPALPDLPIQYADYAAWQREQLDDARLAAGIEFWRAQLDGASQLLELPTDRPRRANRSLRGGKLELVLEDSTARALRELSQETSSTLYMVLFAAFATLLSRYSGQLDVVIGAPAANRDRVELEPLIGLFVNELPIRLSLAGRPSFRALVERVRTRMLAAQANSDIPFFKIVEALRPRRDASHAPLFQVIFVVHNAPSVSSPNAPVAGKEVPALRWSTMPHEVDATKLDLALSVGEADDGLTIALEYSSELFDAGRVQRMLDHYVGLLRAAVDQPDRCLAEVPLRGRSRATSAGDVERSARGEGAWHSFLDAFAHQVRAHPKATAVRDDDQTISYAELDAQSDRLAHLLRSRGVTRDSMVGLCRGPNCTSIACLLAIWKAGATYVPLGPDLPRERLVLILEETKTRLILADGETSARLADLGVEVLVPEHYADTIAQRPRLAAAPLRPEQVAYVIYTSGSTGRPKGVVVGHRGLAAVLRAIAARLTIGPGCRVLQFAAYSFDVSLAEIGATLASGASLVILPKGQAKVGPELERVIVEREVSHLIVSPSVLASLRVEAVPPTLTVIVGGEACSVAHVVKWAPGRRFLNCYGPTETTIGCVGGLCAPTDNPVTMGREFGPTSCVVLDDAMRPAPPGVIGELYIGGPALAHGYLARPRLTAERFVPDPFGEEPGARLYRSGDLAERLEDGRLVFRGRVDRQVKLRGYRIELGEIENALCDDPAVRGAAVIVREDHPGVRQLVAYVVTDADGWDELRISLQRALTGKLPGYMVPSAYIRLSELPLTSTDKLDLSALPAPVVEHHDDEGELSELAALIRQTWVEVLGRTELGIHDNFFELGGDSILSIRIIARLNEAGISLSPRQLFQHQTVAALAAVATRSSERVITATQGPVVGVVPLTPIQRWFLCSDQPAPEHFNMSLHFALREGLTLVGLRAIIDALVTHHDALRSVFERGDLGWTQRILGPEHAARVEEVFLDGDPEHLQAGQAAAAERAHAGFDLTAGPLVHALLFRYRAQPARPPELLIVVHHLVFDAVSSAVVTRDLEALLAQHKGGSALTLPRKTSSFKRWAERLVEFGRGPELAAELCYWKALSGRRASLPRDLVDPAQRGHADVFVSLSSRATRALIDEFPRLLGARVEAALLWTLTRTISKWTRHEGLLVELESHGREDLFDDLDVSRTVGWFTTSYPLWLPFEPERSDADQLTSIQKQLASLPRGGIGYGLLRYVQDDAELREQLQGLPQPEIAFNYFGQLGLAQGERGVLAPGQGPTGNEHSARRRRVHLFELNSVIEGGRLHLRWGYDRGVHRRETVERLAADFIAELERLAASGLALGRRSPEVEIPLSHVQEAMCTVDPSSPLGRSFRRCVSLRFTGTIDAEALRLALTGVVNRHEILRTSFVEREGRWVQIVGPKRTLELSLESLEGPDAERRLSARLRDLERRTLELTSPPLRIELYQLAPERCVLALVLHEMITDLASIDRLTAEVAQLYARLVRDDTRPLPEPALQYGDFAVWERRRLSGDALARELNFWRCELDGSPRALDLPFDRPRPSTRELEARYSPMSDEQWFSTAVDTVAREAAASNFVIMLAGYALLLMERGGVRDVIVGIAVSGRTQPGLRELVGPLVNALPIRVRLEGDPSFVEFAAQVGERLARAQAHDIPIDLIASTQRARPSPGEPIFQCLFSFRRAAPAPSLDAELDVELQFHGETLRSDLALTIVEQSGLLRGGMTFATDVFDEPTVAGLLDGLRGLIAAAAAEPSSLCSRLLRRARPSPQPPTNHQAAQPRAESSGPWFMRPRPRAHPKLRLFCFPYAGGSPAVFRSWAGALGDDIELVGVHAPGRGTRLHETPLRSARALVHELAERFTPFTRSPYALFGHSMGATVAFELAHELRRRGHPLPRRLILAGRRAPLEPKAHPDVHMLPNSDFVLELERLGGTPPDVFSNPELLELVLPALRADFQLIESWRYTPRPRLPVAITAICGDSDPDVSLKHMCGWAEHGSGFELHGLAGGHFFLTTAEDELLALLRRTLAFT